MRVLIADGSSLIHVRIETLLAQLPDVDVVGCAADVENAGFLAETQSPDVVILDASLPGGGCLRMLGKLGSMTPEESPVAIVLASPASPPYRTRLKEAGASFVFDKVNEMDRLVEAIASLARDRAGRPVAPVVGSGAAAARGAREELR